MDLFNEFATDEKREIEGRWVPLSAETKFKIARNYNPEYNKLFTRLFERNKVVLNSKGKVAEDKSEEVMLEVLAKTVLLDWEGPVLIQGENLGAYTVEGAKKALKLKEFRKWVVAQADDFQAFKAVQEAEDVGN